MWCLPLHIFSNLILRPASHATTSYTTTFYWMDIVSCVCFYINNCMHAHNILSIAYISSGYMEYRRGIFPENSATDSLNIC